MDWSTKLFGFLLFFFFCFKGCISTNLTRLSNGQMTFPEENDGDGTNTACNPPYHPAGDYCLLIDNDMQGTWSDMRVVCQSIGGDLVNLQDANILYEISEYLKLNGMDDVSYWVGATDEAEEGKWLWASDNTIVKAGAPLWGIYYGEQPDGGENQNCAALNVREFFYMHDDDCNDSIYGVICQPAASEELSPKGDGGRNTKFSNPNNECYSPYEMIGTACLRVFPEMNYTWTEAKVLCDGPYSHLAKINDANLLGDVYDYLIQRELSEYIWIDGTDEASEDEWMWHDATPMKRGTPFWCLSNPESQEPDDGISQNCAALHNLCLYGFGDYTCTFKSGVMCQYDM